MSEGRHEDDVFALTIKAHPYKDRFDIILDEDKKYIHITRIDQLSGWGQNLVLCCHNKATNQSYELNIGDSLVNQITIPIDKPHDSMSYISLQTNNLSHLLNNQKIYIGLSTIPSRITQEFFFQSIDSLLACQSYPVEKIFVTISKTYKRFFGTQSSIPPNILKRLEKYNKVDIIMADDYGPASKYLGPCEHRKNEIANDLLCIIDDDWIYNPNLLKHLVLGFKLYPDIIFAGGDSSSYFTSDYNEMREDVVNFEIKKYSLNFEGFFGFCFKPSQTQDIVDYHKYMLHSVDGSFFHDDALMRAYINYKNQNMLMLKHKGCLYTYGPPDELCRTSPIHRGEIEEKILQKTNELLQLQKDSNNTVFNTIPEIYLNNSISTLINDKYTYQVCGNKHPDQFNINFYNDYIEATRTDQKHGWDQDLNLTVTQISSGFKKLINIGSCFFVSKKVNICINDIFNKISIESTSEIDYLKVHNILSPKLRIGNNKDGGYVINEGIISNINRLISLGVGHDDSFEKHLLAIKPELVIECYDGNCDCKELCQDNPTLINKNIFYIKQHVGNILNYIPLSTVIGKKNNILLKIDIEGGEYNLFDNVDLSGVIGVIIEAHDLHDRDNRKKLANILEEYLKDFSIFHIHGNNYSDTFPLECNNTIIEQFPKVLEISLCNKRICDTAGLDQSHLPINDLDAPNNDCIPDIDLSWINMS